MQLMFALFIILVFDFDQKQAYAQNKCLHTGWEQCLFPNLSKSNILWSIMQGVD